MKTKRSLIEDLNVRGMMANHSLAGAIGDSGWGEFVRQLELQDASGMDERFVPHRPLVSVEQDVLGVRIRGTMPCPSTFAEWECPACGVTHDRDVNAARNILAAGLAVNRLWRQRKT